jgi:hypothetical protein
MLGHGSRTAIGRLVPGTGTGLERKLFLNGCVISNGTAGFIKKSISLERKEFEVPVIFF